MINKIKSAVENGILFVCVANSARSQIAEGLAKKIFGPTINIQSAGSKPAKVHPLAIKVMKEIGIDISSHWSKSLHDVDMSRVGLVVTLCADEVCPFLPSPSTRLHWFLPNPAIHNANQDDIDLFRKTRDELTEKINLLHKEYLCLPVRTKARKPARASILPDKTRFFAFAPFRKFAFLHGFSALL